MDKSGGRILGEETALLDLHVRLDASEVRKHGLEDMCIIMETESTKAIESVLINRHAQKLRNVQSSDDCHAWQQEKGKYKKFILY